MIKQQKIPEEFLIEGIYFKSDKDVCSHYFITINIVKLKSNAIIKIYNMDISSNIFDVDELINGREIKIYEPSYCACEINLFEKYYFTKFNEFMQLYYDDEKYYGQKHKSNEITSLMECINFAIECGLKKSEIKPC